MVERTEPRWTARSLKNKTWNLTREEPEQLRAAARLSASLPALEAFLGDPLPDPSSPSPARANPMIHERHALRSLQVGMVIQGRVKSIHSSHVMIAIHSIVCAANIDYFWGNARRRESDVLARCPVAQKTRLNEQMKNAAGLGECSQREWGSVTRHQLHAGCMVMAVIIDIVDREVILSFQEKYLLPSWATLRLGPAPPPIPPQDSFIDELRKRRSFADPHRVDKLADYFGINPHETIHDALVQCPPYGDLRRAQSSLYITNTVKKGVAYSTQGRYREAIDCYEEALKLDDKNIDAMVARGAALANMEKFDKAIRQLEHALRFDPHHKNAKKYLLAIEEKLERMRAELGSNSPTHKQRSQVSASEAVLQALLSQEDGKKKKEKKKKRHHSSSSSRSHDDSGRKKRSRGDRSRSPSHRTSKRTRH